MVASVAQIRTKVLRRQRAPDEYRVYRAALEWGLTDPIVIEGRKDFKSEHRWREQIEPYHHQVTNLITFCRRLPVTLLADDVGLGKTISAGLVASELISRSRMSKMLIVCPKLLGPQWRDELQSKFNIPAKIVVGKELIEAEPEDVGAVITTYHSARLYLDKIPDDRFEMLVLDEAHKLRNLYGVAQPPQVAVRFREAFEARRFRYSSGSSTPRIRRGDAASFREAEMYQIVKQIFPDELVLREASPPWLGRQRLDVFLPQRNLALEYQGEQHYQAVSLFGGSDALTRTIERDALKKRLCDENSIELVYVRFSDPLTMTSLKHRLRRFLR
jgi:SNF2-related domain